MYIPLSPYAPENLVSRDGFSRPVPRQAAHLHTQAESGAYLRDSSRVSRQHALIYLNRHKTKLSGANGDREIFISPVQLTMSRIGNLARLIITLTICDDHTYMRHRVSPEFIGSRNYLTMVFTARSPPAQGQ